MALNIKDEATDRLVRELAAESGLSITEAVREAVEARLSVLRRRTPSDSPTELAAVIARGRARSIVDDRTEDEILGLGADGLPT